VGRLLFCLTSSEPQSCRVEGCAGIVRRRVRQNHAFASSRNADCRAIPRRLGTENGRENSVVFALSRSNICSYSRRCAQPGTVPLDCNFAVGIESSFPLEQLQSNVKASASPESTGEVRTASVHHRGGFTMPSQTLSMSLEVVRTNA